ncbi:site-specific integrase [Halomonas rhizosphaerae]|uniref:Site-specific integrase n=1 Tax=Halomonas rhizosphaerae TaxID=3043296 RepID=A0ABT6UU71_9GAMM|nr:site-specific integrase [Halomonas rhizosphaerae]MDI5889502.1 site-specific integrase [Halomonas rhizosphaerae]
MKHFNIVGKGLRAVLIGPGGSVSEAFVEYKRYISRHPDIGMSTMEAYLNHIGIFIEFIYAASKAGISYEEQNLENLMILYQGYLLDASDSEDPTIRETACYTERKKGCTPQSLPVIESALLHFLEMIDIQVRENRKESLFSVYLPNMIERVSSKESARIRTVGWLGGVIRGGTNKNKNRRVRLFSMSRMPAKKPGLKVMDEDYAFPWNKIPELLSSCNSYRDRALYSLLAASGIRTHEALQIQFKHVARHERLDTIKIINPFIDSSGSAGLSESEMSKLRFKGRANQTAYLIEPWKTVFYKELQKYLSFEYKVNVSHNYVFQILQGKNKGRPFFLSNRKDRISTFRKLAKSIGVELPWGVSIHSLRHAWGFYMLNDFPTSNGKGLPKAIVSQMFGHVSISNTEIYAKHDEEVIIDQILRAEEEVYKHNCTYSVGVAND